MEPPKMEVCRWFSFALGWFWASFRPSFQGLGWNHQRIQQHDPNFGRLSLPSKLDSLDLEIPPKIAKTPCDTWDSTPVPSLERNGPWFVDGVGHITGGVLPKNTTVKTVDRLKDHGLHFMIKLDRYKFIIYPLRQGFGKPPPGFTI